MKFYADMTDTMQGDANYSWRQTAVFEAEADASTRTLIRRAKRALGVTRAHRITDDGDTIRLDLRNAAICIFISAL